MNWVPAKIVSHRPGAVDVTGGPLSKRELATARAAFAGLFPRGAHPGIPVGMEDVDTDAPLQALMRAAPTRAVWGVRVALILCALAPVVFLGRAHLLANVDTDTKTRVMRLLLASSLYPVRQLAMLLKMMGALVFGCVPEVRSVMVDGRQINAPLESGPRLIDETSLVRRRGGGRALAPQEATDDERDIA